MYPMFRASLASFGYKVQTKTNSSQCMQARDRPAPLVQCSLSAAQCSPIFVVLPCSAAAPKHESCRWSVHELNWAWILFRFWAFNPLMTNSENIAAGESEAYAAYSVFLCVWCRICSGAWHLDWRILCLLCHIFWIQLNAKFCYWCFRFLFTILCFLCLLILACTF